MYIEPEELDFQNIKQGLEQLNANEDKILWELFLGKKLLNHYPDWSDRFLYWEALNWSLNDIKREDDLLKYFEQVTDIYLKESLRDRMSLLYKKNILWRQGATALFESLGYDISAGAEQFDQELTFKPLAVIYFDLDYFKAYNQLFGHIGGDLVIKRLSRLLLEKYNINSDVVVRIAGEEFFLLLREQLSLADLRKKTEQLQLDVQTMMKQLFFELGQLIDIDFSREEAISLIEDRVENHILLNRALDLNSEFDFSYQKKLQKDLVELQGNINNCKDTFSLKYYENKLNLLADDLQEQRNFDESSDLKKTYYSLRDSFFLENYHDLNVQNYFQKYDVKSLDDLSPARFISILKDLRNTEQPYLRTKAKSIYEQLKIYIGGLTIGVLFLDWQDSDRKTLVPNAVKKQMSNVLAYILLNLGKGALYEKTGAFLANANLSYHDLYKFLFENMDAEYLKTSLQILNKYRFDKILNEITHIEENQKHQKRNEISWKSSSLADIENRNLAKMLDLSKNDQVFQLYQSLKLEIEDLIKKNTALMKFFNTSPVNLWWKNVNEKFWELSLDNEVLKEKALLWSRVFKYRYFDPLLGIFNDQFLLDFESSSYWQARRNDKNYTVVALDFDNLKAVNEAVDHYCGDVVLMKSVLYLFEVFQQWMKKNNYSKEEWPRLIRVTPGEEFIIIFSGRDAVEVKEFLDEYTPKVSQRVRKDLTDLGVLVDIEDYLQNKMGKSGLQLKEIATFTSGIVNAKDYYQSKVDWDLLAIQRLADKIGEAGKLVEKGKNYLDKR